MAKKRSSNGKEKPMDATPPGAQPPKSSVATAASRAPLWPKPAKKQTLHKPTDAPPVPEQSRRDPTRRAARQKLPKLPANASVSKRPLYHPAIPTPFSSASQPKVLYLSHSSPFVPILKRIRRLLLEISKRDAQSQTSQTPRHRHQPRYRNPLQPNGRLAPADVEREIAEEGRAKASVGGEEVYVKATGRAIERALKVGLYFQSESDCRVRVEMGSVTAVDDIEIRTSNRQEDAEDQDAAKEVAEHDDLPETRLRTVSSITVAIGLK